MAETPETSGARTATDGVLQSRRANSWRTRRRDAQLDEVFAINVALAHRSPTLCAARCNGGAEQGEVSAGLARLPDAQLRAGWR